MITPEQEIELKRLVKIAAEGDHHAQDFAIQDMLKILKVKTGVYLNTDLIGNKPPLPDDVLAAAYQRSITFSDDHPCNRKVFLLRRPQGR